MYGTVITERDVKESVSSSFTYNSMHLKGEDDIIASHDINQNSVHDIIYVKIFVWCQKKIIKYLNKQNLICHLITISVMT